MTLRKAKDNLPSYCSDAQDHLKWIQIYSNEDNQKQHSMLEGIKLGIVSHIRLDDILDRKEIR